MQINSINSQYKNNNTNLRNKNSSPTTSPAFKGGIKEPVVNGLSKFYSGLANNGTFQKFVHGFSKSNNTFTHLLVAESCFLSGFYMINTLRNKKIDKEQKPQMIINDTLTLGVSCAGAYLAEDKVTNLVKKGSEKYFANHSDFYTQLGQKAQEKLKVSPKDELLNKVADVAASGSEKLQKGLDDISGMMKDHLKNIVGEEGKLKTFQVTSEKMEAVKTSVKDAVVNNSGNAEKAKETVKGLVDDVYTKSAARAEADNTFAGINKLKVLVVFGIVYRYLGPVVITPIANKLSSKFFNNKKDEKTDTATNKTELNKK